MEANELNVEYGYRYHSAAVIPDGSPEPEPIDDVRLYEPSTRPGSPLPHAWIHDESSKRRPLKDLVAPGRFLLIAGELGQDWCAAAATVAAANGLPIDAVRIGHIDGDLFDPRLTWAQSRGITEKEPCWCGPIGWSAGAAPEPWQARQRHWPKRLGKYWAARFAPSERIAEVAHRKK